MMIFCKVAVCLTIVGSMSVGTSSIDPRSSSRGHRDSFTANDDRLSSPGSNNRDANDEIGAEANDDYSSEKLAGYRFGDEYFNHQSGEKAEASETEISGLENAKKKPEGCERVVRDTMICMVCKDSRTNSNYEQCSYVARPKERAQSYSSSRSFTDESAPRGNDGLSDNKEEKAYKAPSYGRYGNEDDAKENGEGIYAYEGQKKYAEDDDGNDGGKYEERESSPSSPASFLSLGGYRDDERDDEDKSADEEENEPRNYEDDIRLNGQTSSESESSAHHRREENFPFNRDGNSDRGATSEESSVSDDEPSIGKSKNKKQGGQCREIQKDSMTCTICEDPENGGNFEKCSYKHQPNDKLYKFSKSKSFGYPTASEDDSSSSPEETKRVSKIVDGTTTRTKTKNCRKFRKNDSTVCSVCKNMKTGQSSEQCEYSANVKPASTRSKI